MSAQLVLVTGGSGFLGSHCILKLLEQGYRVRTTVRSLKRADEVRVMLKRGGAELGEAPGEALQFFAADLGADAGWAEAVAGCDYVLHVASPFPVNQPKDPEELIGPARDGALRVLKAAKAAGVKRVVLTSSFAAIGYGLNLKDGIYTEANWTDLSKDVSPYVRSKTIAERAAWDYVAGEGKGLDLAVINPVAIFGPLLGPDMSTSIVQIKQMLDGKTPALPQIMFGVVDVRDCADLHVLAMTNPKAAGERFLCSAGDFITVQQIALALKDGLGDKAAKVSTRVLPNSVVRFAALFSQVAKQATSFDLGKFKNGSNEKARRLLSWSPRAPQEAIVATGKSLIELGLIAK